MPKIPFRSILSLPSIRKLFSYNQQRKGVRCPCCGKWFKINRKKLNRTMLQYLRKFAKHRYPGDGWIQASRLSIMSKDESSIDGASNQIRTGDYKILVLWDLVEVHSENSALYRITTHGENFLDGNASVREAVLIENNKNSFIDFDGPWITVQDVEKVAFNREEL